MSNSVFPALTGIGWPVIKRPAWNSRIQRAVGGRETRISLMSLPIWRWTVLHNYLGQDADNSDYATLADFFNARQGQYDSFLYSDPTDSTIADTSPATRQVFGTGNGATVAFQLVRSLTSGGLREPIYNVHAAPKIYVANVLKTVGTDYTLSGTGLVTFTSAPAGAVALTWSGSYYWRCRFDQDSADFSNFASGFWEQTGLSFVSVLGS